MSTPAMRSWMIAVGLVAALTFGPASRVLANGDRDCGLQSDTSRNDATPSAQSTFPTYCLTDLGTLLYSGVAINNRGQVLVNLATGAFVYKDNHFTGIPPVSGSRDIVTKDINDSGDAVGISVIGDSYITGYEEIPVIYSRGKTVRIAGLVADFPIPQAINNSRHVAGWDNRRDRPPVPFFVKEGRVTVPTEAGQALAINNRDAVVGAKLELWEPWKSKAFMYKNARLTDLGTLPGHICSSANAINDRDQIVGISAPVNNCNVFDPGYPSINGGRAFLYNPGKGMVNLGTLRSSDAYSVARAINVCGQVVGFSGTSAHPRFETGEAGLGAFLYAKGKMVDLNSRVFNRSALHLTVASGINDHGRIVGRGLLNGQLHAFLLTPRHRGADCSNDGQH